MNAPIAANKATPIAGYWLTCWPADRAHLFQEVSSAGAGVRSITAHLGRDPGARVTPSHFASGITVRAGRLLEDLARRSLP
jgi:hypothetical protein